MNFRKTAFRLLFVPILFLYSLDISAQELDSSVRTLVNKTYSLPVPTKKNFLLAKVIVIPTAFVGYGFTSLTSGGLQSLNKKICEEVEEDCSGFNTRADDYLK